jgi:hypothetical protein
MYSTKDDLREGERVKIIGKVTRIESPKIYLETPKGEVAVKYVNLHKYVKSYLCVTGVVDDEGCIIEEMVDHLDDNFDVSVHEDFVRVSKSFPELF